MSISLDITWPNAPGESVPVAGQRMAEEWARIGRENVLQYVPTIHSLLVVEPANIEQVIEELVLLRSHFAGIAGEEQSVESLDRLCGELSRLRGRHGWRASIG